MKLPVSAKVLVCENAKGDSRVRQSIAKYLALTAKIPVEADEGLVSITSEGNYKWSRKAKTIKVPKDK